MNSYAEVKQHPAVASVEFVGAGIAKVTLNDNYSNKAFAAEHGLADEQVLYAPFLRTAVEFVQGAKEYHMVQNLMSGKMVRQAVDTPISCDVSSERYWSM